MQARTPDPWSAVCRPRLAEGNARERLVPPAIDLRAGSHDAVKRRPASGGIAQIAAPRRPSRAHRETDSAPGEAVAARSAGGSSPLGQARSPRALALAAASTLAGARTRLAQRLLSRPREHPPVEMATPAPACSSRIRADLARAAASIARDATGRSRAAEVLRPTLAVVSFQQHARPWRDLFARELKPRAGFGAARVVPRLLDQAGKLPTTPSCAKKAGGAVPGRAAGASW